jgi:hypothetical protein
MNFGFLRILRTLRWDTQGGFSQERFAESSIPFWLNRELDMG